MTEAEGKTCALCGKDTTDMPRIKDAQGRYYHDRCYVAAQRARWRRDEAVSEASSAADAATAASHGEFDAAQEGNETMMSFLLHESRRRIRMPVKPETAEAAESGCPECGTYAAPTALFCTRCGANLRTGEQLRTEVRMSRRKRRLLRRFDPLWKHFDMVARQLAPGVAIVFGLLFLTSLLAPDPMLKIFFAAVVAVLAVGHLCMTALGLRERLSTGLAVLLVPFYSAVFFLESASSARRPVMWTAVLGVSLLGASFGLSVASERLWSEQRADLATPVQAERPGETNSTRSADSRNDRDDDTDAAPEVANDALATNGMTDPRVSDDDSTSP